MRTQLWQLRFALGGTVAVKPASHILTPRPGYVSCKITITKMMITNTPIMTPIMPLFTLPPLSSRGQQHFRSGRA